ncbi:hypothetical protein [Hymenobacter sp. BT730]|uniref:hypothetical protein n=1 Tax=Hymenobacter sp. BT730 TaxID=3063332 RepID=UPI0026E099C4|nr:hypothetical protein [Hymenobacter sp. BT730]
MPSSSSSLKAGHRLSGLVLGVFIALHLGNHVLALHSIAWHQWGMTRLRLVYRQPVVETLLLAAVLWQIGSGLLLVCRGWPPATPFFERVQGYSGLYLALFLLIHVGAVLVGRYVWHVETDFYFAARGLNTAPWYWFFGPYYLLAVGAIFGHLAAAHYRNRRNRDRAPMEALLILVSGFVLGLLLVLGFTNYFRGIPVPVALVKAVHW